MVHHTHCTQWVWCHALTQLLIHSRMRKRRNSERRLSVKGHESSCRNTSTICARYTLCFDTTCLHDGSHRTQRQQGQHRSTDGAALATTPHSVIYRLEDYTDFAPLSASRMRRQAYVRFYVCARHGPLCPGQTSSEHIAAPYCHQSDRQTRARDAWCRLTSWTVKTSAPRVA
jgi:hypothetical protein